MLMLPSGSFQQSNTPTSPPLRRWARRKLPSVTSPEEVHEWISFKDPNEHRTSLFDATYLRSNYMCICGRGRNGILDEPAPELTLGRRSFGAHYVDAADVANVEPSFDRMLPEHMQFFADAMANGITTQGETITMPDPDEPDEQTVVGRLVDDACIFLNRPSFEGGVGCSLHIAAEAAGERSLD
jgi:hypothetical protein